MRRAAVAAAWCLGLALLAGCGRTATARNTAGSPGSEPVGPGPQPARNATGAVDSLNAAQLSGRHVDDVAELLQGRIAGLQVIRGANGAISLRIRGMDSLQEDGDALVVLDGMPVAPQNLSTVLRALSPNEIVSIDVLKDVASTSVYGIQGAHGVVVIRTKHD